MIRVVHFQRRPQPGQLSIERVFDQVRRALPSSIACSVQVSPKFSRGLLQRTENLWDARRAGNGAGINHITGDVHYLAAVLEGRRTVLTVHDCVSLRRLRGLKRMLFRWAWYDWPLRRVGVVTAVSEFVRGEILGQVRCAGLKIRVIPNCIGSEFQPAPQRFNQDNPLILQVGTGPTKNVERTVIALAGLKCRLKIIGGLSVRQLEVLSQSRLLYSNLPRASDAELLQAYRECDLVVFASSYEGFGLPIVEANVTGRAVITSNVCAMPEVAGKAACLVNPGDVGSIRAGVLRVINEPGYRKWLVEAGFENIKRFEAASVARQYGDVYAALSVRREGVHAKARSRKDFARRWWWPENSRGED